MGKANEGLCNTGVIFLGEGFLISEDAANHLLPDRSSRLAGCIKPYRSGRDINQRNRNLWIIDLDGQSIDEVRRIAPRIYQHLLATVKPERELNREAYRRENWWLFARPNTELRQAIEKQSRYIATVLTSKHRNFSFVSGDIMPDQTLVCIASNDAALLGILSSRIHIVWSLRAGGWLGVGNDSRYLKTRCFDPFPFPEMNNIQQQTIRTIAEELDSHRRRVLAQHDHLALTSIYNVLEKLRAGVAHGDLDEKERKIFDDGLVLILKELHDRLDRAVAQAFGWPVDLSDEEILTRLVALNKQRAAEERSGLVRWLRPDYQIPRFAKGLDRQAAEEVGAQVAAQLDVTAKEQKPSFPTSAVEQTAAVFGALARASAPLSAAAIAAQFRKTKTGEAKIAGVLASLARLGHVTTDGKEFALRRVA